MISKSRLGEYAWFTGGEQELISSMYVNSSSAA
jgi:hypothetical protein